MISSSWMVGAEDADDLVVGVGDHRGDGDDELARDLRLMDVRDVQLSGAHGLEEPLAVRVVEPDREGLVALLIARGSLMAMAVECPFTSVT